MKLNDLFPFDNENEFVLKSIGGYTFTVDKNDNIYINSNKKYPLLSSNKIELKPLEIIPVNYDMIQILQQEGIFYYDQLPDKNRIIFMISHNNNSWFFDELEKALTFINYFLIIEETKLKNLIK